MSNLKGLAVLRPHVMDPTEVPGVGIDHPTVVPANLEPTAVDRDEEQPGRA